MSDNAKSGLCFSADPLAAESGALTVHADPQAAATPALGLDQACLITIHPAGPHHNLLKLEGEQLVIGRDAECHVFLDDASVSRTHAIIERKGDKFLIRDLGSTNGTFVNEEQVKTSLLKAGDQVRVGMHVFKFLASEDLEAQYHETVYSMMTRDGLTGVFNRRYFFDVLNAEFARARRHGHPVSVVIIDADNFKGINDTHGHLVGDEVLRELAKRLTDCFRGYDTLARYGGEEFVVLLPHASDDDARVVAERCREAIAAASFSTTVGEINVTVSLGVACSSDVDSLNDPQALLLAADVKLYAAKEGGRNRVG